jgi:hypothetical protein
LFGSEKSQKDKKGESEEKTKKRVRIKGDYSQDERTAPNAPQIKARVSRNPTAGTRNLLGAL